MTDHRQLVSEGDTYRKQYAEGIKAFIKEQNRRGNDRRRAFMPPEKMASHQEEYRACLIRMLGLDQWEAPQTVEAAVTEAGEDSLCRFYRVVVPITPEIPFHGLLFVPKGVEKAPLVIAQHGGDGTPELCADLNGKNNYNRMVRRLLEKKTVVFAPQLLLWNTDTPRETAPCHPVPYQRRDWDLNLRRFGMSMTALEIRGIMNAVTALSAMDFVEEEKIAMMGCSYGGYYTLYTMAVDRRIKAGYSSAVFNDRNRYSWSDWCYQNSAHLFQDAEVAALCAPRKLYVSVGREDSLFDYTTAVGEAERVKPYYEACGCAECFVFDLWEGGHTLRPTDEGIDFMLSAFADERRK